MANGSTIQRGSNGIKNSFIFKLEHAKTRNKTIKVE